VGSDPRSLVSEEGPREHAHQRQIGPAAPVVAPKDGQKAFDVGLIHFAETAYFRQPLHGQVPKMTHYGGVAVRCENWKVARSFLYRRLASQPARLRRAKEGI
jgi:hypothetical protein